MTMWWQKTLKTADGNIVGAQNIETVVIVVE
jgi:hypothetical protein